MLHVTGYKINVRQDLGLEARKQHYRDIALVYTLAPVSQLTDMHVLTRLAKLDIDVETSSRILPSFTYIIISAHIFKKIKIINIKKICC